MAKLSSWYGSSERMSLRFYTLIVCLLVTHPHTSKWYDIIVRHWHRYINQMVSHIFYITSSEHSTLLLRINDNLNSICYFSLLVSSRRFWLVSFNYCWSSVVIISNAANNNPFTAIVLASLSMSRPGTLVKIANVWMSFCGLSMVSLAVWFCLNYWEKENRWRKLWKIVPSSIEYKSYVSYTASSLKDSNCSRNWFGCNGSIWRWSVFGMIRVVLLPAFFAEMLAFSSSCSNLTRSNGLLVRRSPHDSCLSNWVHATTLQIITLVWRVFLSPISVWRKPLNTATAYE